MEMTLEQQRAIALANARLRLQQQPSVMQDVGSSVLSQGGAGLAMNVDALNPMNMAQDFGRDISSLGRQAGYAYNAMTGQPNPQSFVDTVGDQNPSTPLARYVSSLYTPQTPEGEYAGKAAFGAGATAAFGPAGMLRGAAGGITSQAGGDLAAGAFGEGARPYGEFGGAFVGPKMVDMASYSMKPDVSTERGILNKQYNEAWDAVDQSQSLFKRSSVRDFASQAADELKRQGYAPSQHTNVANALKDLKNMPQEDLRPAGLDAYMKRLQSIGGDESALAGMLRSKLTDWLDNVTPNVLKSGNPEDAGLIRNARQLTRKQKAFELADQTEREIGIRAPGSTKPTRSLDRMRSIALDEQQMRFLTPEQRSAIETAATPSMGLQALREGGKLMPNRLLGFGATGAGVGATAAGHFSPLLAIPNALGVLSELGYRGLVNKNTGNALSSLRGMSPYKGYGILGTSVNSSGLLRRH